MDLAQKFHTGLNDYYKMKSTDIDENYNYIGYLWFNEDVEKLYWKKDSRIIEFFGGKSKIPFELLNKKYKKKPTENNECVCHTHIKRNCFLFNPNYRINGFKQIIIIGYCCCEKFTENGLNKKCINCGDFHKNRKDRLCSPCRVGGIDCKTCNQFQEFKSKKIKECVVCYKKRCKCGSVITNEKYDKCYNCNIKNTKQCSTYKCSGRVKGDYKICYNCNLNLKKKFEF
jgi:hypothetical protein